MVNIRLILSTKKLLIYFVAFILLLLVDVDIAYCQDYVSINQNGVVMQDYEIKDISTKLKNLSDEKGADFVVVFDDGGYDIEQSAKKYYIEHNIGRTEGYDGVILFIDMYNRNLWMQTAGKSSKMLSQGEVDKILDNIVENGMKDDNLYLTLLNYIDGIKRYHKLEITFFNFLIALIPSALVAGIYIFAVKKSYLYPDSVKIYDTRQDAKAKFATSKDSLISDRTTFIINPKTSSSDSSGRGSSGRSFGSGGGRKF